MRAAVWLSQAGYSCVAFGRRNSPRTLKVNRYFCSKSEESIRIEKVRAKNKNFLAWAAGITVGVFGLTYGTVPLYRMFCQATGFGGTTREESGGFFGFKTPTQETKIVPTERPLTIYFTADVNSDLPWTFVPEQREVKVLPGETALAFYRAENKSDEDILGIATYNVQPPKADPEFVKDSKMNDVTDISLSYTFFPSEGVSDEMLQKMGWYRDENNHIISKESPAVYPIQSESST